MTAPSLFERLGGVSSIATVVDDFIDRIMVDDFRSLDQYCFNAILANKAARNVSMG